MPFQVNVQKLDLRGQATKPVPFTGAGSSASTPIDGNEFMTCPTCGEDFDFHDLEVVMQHLHPDQTPPASPLTEG